jgi:hypothetical protein
MVFNRYSDGFDKCDPPVCSENVSVEIINIICAFSKKVYVDWVIHDTYNRDVLVNQILWSCDNQIFDNVDSPINSSEPYRSEIDADSCNGVIYLKARIKIQATFIESDVKIFDMNSCQSSNDLYLANWCGICPDLITSAPTFDLYVRAKAIPYTPVYFQYNSYCFYIGIDSEKVSETQAYGIIIDDIGNVYNDCEDCC